VGSSARQPRRDAASSARRSKGTGPDLRAPAPIAPAGFAILVLAVVCAALVRVLAAHNDLWLDEIWSLQLARSVGSPLEILTRLHLDNNHCLNTWLMYLMRNSGSDWVYRVPALIAGIGTVILAGLIGRRIAGGMRGALTAVLLTGGSYLLIQYSSEARGYALAGAFALGAWFVALRGLDDRKWIWPVLFWCAVILGLLSHATFIAQAYCGLLVWSLSRMARSRGSWRRISSPAARWHAVPLLAILLFYLTYLRHLEIGGGPRFTWYYVLGRLSAFTLGLPAGASASIAATLAVAALIAIGLVTLRRERSDLWLLYAANCLIFPAALLLVRQPERLFERYFFVSAVFFVMLTAQLLALWVQRGGAWRTLAVLLLAAMLAGSAVHTVRLLRLGRGQYAAALRYVYDHSAPGESVITVASDHDFRNRMVIDYYGKKLPADKSIVYVSGKELPQAGAEWLILHSRDEAKPKENAISAGGHGPFRFQQAYPYAAMSGFNWFVYKLDAAETGGRPPE
jgi:hypothetical protein